MTTKYLSVKEAAKYANVKPASIYYHINTTGKLKARKVPVSSMWDAAYRVEVDSLNRLYYKTLSGEKQHVAKVSPISNIPNTDECVQAAIQFLKDRGYKILKPVITHEEI